MNAYGSCRLSFWFCSNQFLFTFFIIVFLFYFFEWDRAHHNFLIMIFTVYVFLPANTNIKIAIFVSVCLNLQLVGFYRASKLGLILKNVVPSVEHECLRGIMSAIDCLSLKSIRIIMLILWINPVLDLCSFIRFESTKRTI